VLAEKERGLDQLQLHPREDAGDDDAVDARVEQRSRGSETRCGGEGTRGALDDRSVRLAHFGRATEVTCDRRAQVTRASSNKLEEALARSLRGRNVA
jgi:hypothetical protein